MAQEDPDQELSRSNRRGNLLHGELSDTVLSAFYFTYNVLGYGFLESVYRRALAIELRLRGLRVEEEYPVRIDYRNIEVGFYRMDLLVETCLGLELKATDVLHPRDRPQLFNCLKGSSLDVGLLLHYGPSPKFYRLLSPKARSRNK